MEKEQFTGDQKALLDRLIELTAELERIVGEIEEIEEKLRGKKPRLRLV